MTIRCSSLPLAFSCAGSIHSAPGELRIEHATEGASLGSAVHEVLSQLVTEGDLPDVRPAALKWTADVDELGRLARFGAQAWREIGHAFPNPLTEQELTAGELIGHLDILSLRLAEASANVADWKSGYKQADHYAQLMGYATLVCENFPDVQTVFLTLAWLRDREIETFRATRDAVAEWNREFEARILQWDGVSYAAGAHCQYCPRFASCPARQAIVRSAIRETGDGEFDRILAVGNRNEVMPAIVGLYRSGKLALAEQVLKRIDQLIRQEIQVNGPLGLGNGRELALVPEPRDTIKALEAWPIVTKYLTPEQLAPAVAIRKTALLDAVRATVSKGKGKLAEQVMAELKGVDAVESKEIFKLKERAIVKKEVAP